MVEYLFPIIEDSEEWFMTNLGQDIYLRSLRVATFRESFDKRNNGSPLGLLAEELVIAFTRIPDNVDSSGSLSRLLHP